MAENHPFDQENDDLLADFHIAQARKTANKPQSASAARSSQQATAPKRSAPTDMPKKPDGTPYSVAELRQLQASRQALRNRQTPYGEMPPAKPLPPRQDPRRQTERTRRQNAYEAAYHQQNPGQKKPVYRHRKPAKPNGALLLFTLLVLTVTGFSIHQIAQNRREAAPETDTTFSADTENILTETQPTETEEPAPEELVLWNTTVVSNEQIDEGVLILVNYQYPYGEADTIAVKDVYGSKNAYYQVSSTNIALTQITIDAMNAMTEAFYTETGSDDMIIVSGYRDVQSQRDIYNDRVATQGPELAALYVANPGYSEHHTGLAMDLSFYTDEGTSVSIENYEHGPWINENCADYGFVLRYPSGKVDITKIGYEFWHYRYVGIPHATLMSNLNLCLEEYIEYLRQYTTETKLLWIQASGLSAEVSPTALPSEGTLIYYVPAAEGENTEIRVPRGNLFGNTEISGNNADGFIVTVHIGS